MTSDNLFQGFIDVQTQQNIIDKNVDTDPGIETDLAKMLEALDVLEAPPKFSRQQETRNLETGKIEEILPIIEDIDLQNLFSIQNLLDAQPITEQEI